MQLSPLSCSGLQRETERGAARRGGGRELTDNGLREAQGRKNGLMRQAESCLPSHLISGQNYFSAALVAELLVTAAPHVRFSFHSTSPLMPRRHVNTNQRTRARTNADVHTHKHTLLFQTLGRFN